MSRETLEDVINEIDDWNAYREFVINEFIDKYDNNYMIVSHKLRISLDTSFLMRNSKYITLMINYIDKSEGNDDIYSTEDLIEVNGYQYMNRINFIEHDDLYIRCGYNEDMKKTYLENSIIYLNTESTKRKYKIRNLI
jgi:hypothetical protein